ncbi:cytosolic protein [Bacillus sp. HMF5848]|uniref:DUF6154 family protein n=1 Tax=Bacillus sp. HMF5848 TaxID=2495421 RepID=UPI000F7B7631|nr:DUF6154 family protein [Bacillus sp. HMF5848]RSK28265.1 cytosolic protein [Bacillus sp. HMF5848]
MRKFIQELYNMYREKLSGDEEDADFLAFSVLEELNREDLMEFIQEMGTQELTDMVGLYMIEHLKALIGEEQISEMKSVDHSNGRIIH